jgi:hypothetical protein
MPLKPAKKMLSDAEMAKLEAGQGPKHALSDEEMADLEAKNPSDARANGLDLMKRFNDAGYKTATPGFFHDALNGASTGLDAVTLGNLKYNPEFRGVVDNAYQESPAMSRLGWAGGQGALAAASFLGPEAPILMSGLQGLATRPEGAENGNLTDDSVRRLTQGGIGMGVGGGLQIAGYGFGKLGDYAMQKAVGLPKYIPGMGNRIADEGLIGTKGFMQKQINGPGEDPGLVDRMLQKLGITGKMANREAAIDATLPQLRGNVPAKASEDAVNREMGRFVPKGSAPVDPGNVAPVNAGMDRLIAITKRGDLPPADALDSFRKIDRGAYDTSVPMGRIQRDFAQADSGAGRAALKDMATSQGRPELAQNLASEQALINARSGMDTEVPLPQRLMAHARRGVFGTMAGEMVGHGVPGAITGWAAAEGLSTPLALSTIGQMGTKTAQAIPYARPGFVDEMVRQAMAGGSQ